MQIVLGVFFLSVISALATWSAGYFNLPIPGPILGFLLLLLVCMMRKESWDALDRASKFLTMILPLLIMPSCIGIMDHWYLIKDEWLAITVAVSASVLLTLITTPMLIARVERERGAP